MEAEQYRILVAQAITKSSGESLYMNAAVFTNTARTSK